MIQLNSARSIGWDQNPTAFKAVGTNCANLLSDETLFGEMSRPGWVTTLQSIKQFSPKTHVA